MTTNQTTEGHFNLQALSDHIVELSAANTLSAAASEWEVTNGYLAEDWGHCACGQRIRHVCVITNRTTNESTEVGSTCVKRFLGLDVASAFTSLANLKVNNQASVNKALADLMLSIGRITEWEHGFLVSIKRKRVLSINQAAKRASIVIKVLK